MIYTIVSNSVQLKFGLFITKTSLLWGILPYDGFGSFGQKLRVCKGASSVFFMSVFAIKTKVKALFCIDVMKNTYKKHSCALIFKKEGVNLQPIKTKIKES